MCFVLFVEQVNQRTKTRLLKLAKDSMPNGD